MRVCVLACVRIHGKDVQVPVRVTDLKEDTEPECTTMKQRAILQDLIY